MSKNKSKNKKDLKTNVKKLKKVKNLKVRLSVFAIIMLVFASVFIFESQIYQVINNKDFYGYENTIKQDINIHFIDVGQGDAMAIRLPDNKKILIDSGPTKSADKLVKYLENSFFLPNESKTFDYFLVSHTDEDHIGGGAKVFQTFQINQLLRPNIYTQKEADALRDEFGNSFVHDNNISRTNTLKNFVSESEKEPNMTALIYDYLTLPTILGQNYSFTFLTPVEKTYNNINNYSSLILFEYHKVKVLFTGDAEKVVEDQALVKYGHLLSDIDILKVGHHGSNTSSSQNFVDVVNPRYSVIQVGKDNRYNHPTAQTLNGLENSNILRNDLHGNIVVGFSKTDVIYTFVTTNTFLPSAVEVWQVYVSGGLVLFYFVVLFDFKKLKLKLK